MNNHFIKWETNKQKVSKGKRQMASIQEKKLTSLAMEIHF